MLYICLVNILIIVYIAEGIYHEIFEFCLKGLFYQIPNTRQILLMVRRPPPFPNFIP